MPATVVLPRS